MILNMLENKILTNFSLYNYCLILIFEIFAKNVAIVILNFVHTYALMYFLFNIYINIF